MEDIFFTDQVKGMVQVITRAMRTDGEWQLKHHLLAHHSPPVVWPSSQQPMERYKSVVQWLGIPDLESLKLLRRTMGIFVLLLGAKASDYSFYRA